MITCYFGKLGQGKTYALAEHALRELKRGRIVYSNFYIKWDGLPAIRYGPFKRPMIPATNFRKFGGVEEFMEMEDAFVALDEGWIYFDSYKVTKLPLEVRMKILQSRKDGLDIAYTTQRPEQVHKSLRAMTNELYECQAGRIPFINKPVFYRYECDLVHDVIKREQKQEYIERKTADGGSQWIPTVVERRPKIIWPSQEVFDSFDTSEKIAVSAVGKLSHAPKPITSREKLQHEQEEKDKQKVRKRDPKRDPRMDAGNEVLLLEKQQHTSVREKQRRSLSVPGIAEVHSARTARHSDGIRRPLHRN